ncbi:amino acid kinase family protein [Wolbachia endosymbiont of Atemnus politus]|uniref:amino acid kinase family protein n=1 Tax=Wolbachia endosymbiont of Atemnus politus TaxID=2682840 RepID=UPI001FED0E52|nr:hypothetical protein [Wolbachia endosymbiont of Atemnus politus]
MKNSEFSNDKISFGQRGEILLEVLSNIPNFVGETFVIKCSNVTISNEILFNTIVHNVVLLKQIGINPVIVHDGEREINSVLKPLGLGSKFVNNIRFTDKDTMKIIEMALCGSVNKKNCSVHKFCWWFGYWIMWKR